MARFLDLQRKVLGPVLLWHAVLIFILTIGITFGLLSYMQTLAQKGLPVVVWAEITELHTEWNARQGKVRLSLRLNRRTDCVDILVDKDLRLVNERGEIVGFPIKLNGELPDKIARAPLGKSVIFDLAAPRLSIPPGRYVLTVTASCLSEDGQLEATTPKTAELVVPEPRSVNDAD